MGQATAVPTEPTGSERPLVFELPQPMPITEDELRALEILLGDDLRELLAEIDTRTAKDRLQR